MERLCHVMNFFLSYICSQSFDSLLVVGDFNVDFNRGGTNCAQLLNFMDEYDLSAVDLCHQSSIKYTYVNSDGSAKS